MYKVKQICKNCINFLKIDDHCWSCDYDHWENIPFLQSILYTPGMFGCMQFEYSIEIKEYINNEIETRTKGKN